MKYLTQGFGVLLVLAAMASVSRAGDPAPEIDPGTAGGALTLISGALLILKDRLRGKFGSPAKNQSATNVVCVVTSCGY